MSNATSAVDRAEDLRTRILKNTPAELSENDVDVGMDTVDATGEVRAFVKVELPYLPSTRLDSDEVVEVPDDQQKQLIKDKEEYRAKVQDFRQAVTSVVDSLAAGDQYRVHGYGKFEPTHGRATYYTVEVKNSSA